MGLSLNETRSYVKCYMGDTGLLVSHDQHYEIRSVSISSPCHLYFPLSESINAGGTI